MKTHLQTIAALCMMLTAVSGCRRNEPTSEAAPAPDATPAPALAALPAATSTPTAAVPTPATPAPQLAPPGVFYLIVASRVETASGVIGLRPGTMLRLVRPGVYLANTDEVTLAADQVTNDLVLARRAALGEQAAQQSIRAKLTAPARAAPPAMAVQTQTPQVPASPVVQPHATGLGGTPQLGGNGALGETGAAKSSVTWHTDAQGRQYHNGSYGRIYR